METFAGVAFVGGCGPRGRRETGAVTAKVTAVGAAATAARRAALPRGAVGVLEAVAAALGDGGGHTLAPAPGRGGGGLGGGAPTGE